MTEYETWLEKAVELPQDQLDALQDEATREDAFRCELTFGTAGLRGIIGAGPNRMNLYTVGKATQGLAEYLLAHYEKPSVAIARDSRNFGKEFVECAAGVLAANGVHAYVYPRVEPTPALSFAVRCLGASAGINVTASHNPAEYNGYKVYGADGCQIASDAAVEIQAAIDGIDFFEGIKKVFFSQALENGLVSWIDDDVLNKFLDAVEAQSLDGGPGALKLVYTPLNGTGMECVGGILKRIGIDDVTVVEQQAHPDGNFPTCTYPNPEAREALELGLSLCEEVKPDLLLATDPDADRVGIAVPHGGEYVLLTGNEVGILMLDYACKIRKQRGEDLSRSVAITTIVSTAMVDAVAKEYGIQLRRTLTGFKYIGGQIALLEEAGEKERFIFGFEESYGYLAGTHVRDKDAVVASMIICQMARWYRTQGMDLVQAMDALYEKHGYYLNKTVSLSYPGGEGAQKMKALTAGLRNATPKEIAGRKVVGVTDFAAQAAMPIVNACEGEEKQVLPAADVQEFALEDGCKLLVRPSGTEPKIKAYLFAKASTHKEAQEAVAQLEQAARELLA